MRGLHSLGTIGYGLCNRGAGQRPAMAEHRTSILRQATGGAFGSAAPFIAIFAAVAILAACQPLSARLGGPNGSAAATVAGTGGTPLLDRNVEAPDVFRALDEGLWDGRPSLGGIWVAAPEVTDPERVLMRNPSNGQQVVGALFRRERITPGPPLQLSSEAAVALGILAGSPTEIEVVALREADPPPPEAEPLVEPATIPDADEGAPVAAAAPDAPPLRTGILGRLFRRTPPDGGLSSEPVTDIAPAPET